jgi:hypothetical protein
VQIALTLLITVISAWLLDVGYLLQHGVAGSEPISAAGVRFGGTPSHPCGNAMLAERSQPRSPP